MEYVPGEVSENAGENGAGVDKLERLLVPPVKPKPKGFEDEEVETPKAVVEVETVVGVGAFVAPLASPPPKGLEDVEVELPKGFDEETDVDVPKGLVVETLKGFEVVVVPAVNGFDAAVTRGPNGVEVNGAFTWLALSLAP